MGPIPLSVGTLVAQRFEIEGVLGQGGFGITYRACDTELSQACVLKELAPSGTERLENGQISFASYGPAASQRLRKQFQREGEIVRKLGVAGVVPAYAEVEDLGTAYLALKAIDGAMPLDRLLIAEGRLEPEAVAELMVRLLAVLSQVHAKGVLHRDIKPSNILLAPTGEPLLIDFGSAREWIADFTQRQTVVLTPGFAPLEQLAESARRGPGTDLYGLSATAWTLLVGQPPVSAADRAAGRPLPRLSSLRPDVPEDLEQAIHHGLALALSDRPPTADAMLAQLRPLADDGDLRSAWQLLDEKTVELQRLRPKKRECPNCGGVLGSPKPTKERVCLACRKGSLALRDLSDRACPACHAGVLKPVENQNPLRFCPVCRIGQLRSSGLRLPWSEHSMACLHCKVVLHEKGGLVKLPDLPDPVTWDDLREASGRAGVVWLCDSCELQMDEMPDGRRLWVHPNPGHAPYRALYPEEWARVAAKLDPGAGNAFCPECEADYFWEGDRITLLGVHREVPPHVEGAIGRAITLDGARWVAVGKASGNPGLVCDRCDIEFDEAEEGLTLAGPPKTGPHADHLIHYAGDTADLPNWHRRARVLPPVGEEEEFDQALLQAIVDGFTAGELGSDPFWVASAQLDGKKGKLVCGNSGLEFKRLIGGLSLDWEDVVSVQATADDTLWLELTDQRKLVLKTDSALLAVDLKSGARRVLLTAVDLAERLHRCQLP